MSKKAAAPRQRNASTLTVCGHCFKLNRVPVKSPVAKFAVCGGCGAELPVTKGVTVLKPETLETLLRKSPLPVVVDFWASWCHPCRTFAPIFTQAAYELAEQGRAVCAKIDTEAYPDTSLKYHVRGIPTSIVFQSGREVARESGAVSLGPFLEWVDEALRETTI